jgi:hypothetical protein
MVIVLITSIDHSKNRSDFTEHLNQNNNPVTPGLGGQLIPAKDGQGQGLFQVCCEEYIAFFMLVY